MRIWYARVPLRKESKKTILLKIWMDISKWRHASFISRCRRDINRREKKQTVIKRSVTFISHRRREISYSSSSFLMLLLCSLLSILLWIPSSTSDQSCVDNCQFEYDIETEFLLPTRCRYSRRDQCSAMLNFDHVKQTVAIEFGSPLPRQATGMSGETETIAHTVINLEDTSFIHQTVEYFCSTGDACELDYVRTIAIPKYSRKRCGDFQKELMKYLHPNSTSLQRNCYVSETTLMLCNLPCDLFYTPDAVKRACDGQVDVAFETSVGRSTPIDLPDYRARLFAYGCTGQLCNGPVMQKVIEKLIDSDQGQCLISVNETTTSGTPSTLVDPTQGRAFIFVSSFMIIFIAAPNFFLSWHFPSEIDWYVWLGTLCFDQPRKMILSIKHVLTCTPNSTKQLKSDQTERARFIFYFSFFR